MLIWPTGRLWDPNNYIIEAKSTSHCMKLQTLLMDEMRSEEAGKTRDELAAQLSKLPWRCQPQHWSQNCILLLERRFCLIRITAAMAFQPYGKFPRQSNSPEREDARKASKHCFWNVESINLTFLLV